VVRELDRLARNLAKQLYVEQQLKRAGVEIRYALYDYPDTPEGNFQKHVRAIVAELEREKIIERTVRGRRHAARSGSVLVGKSPPYGYEAIREDGKTRLQICEPEAQVIRLIFTWYTEGDEDGKRISINDIARKLSELHLPSYGDTGTRKWKSRKKRPRGQWSRMSVYYIVRNATYAGRWQFGKTRQIAGRWVRNPDGHAVEVEVPPIITPEVWARAQERTAGARLARSAHRRRKSIDVQYVGTCTAPMYRVDEADGLVWSWLRSWLMEPEQLAEGLREYQAAHRPAVSRMADQARQIEGLLASRRDELERALDLHLSGRLSQGLLIERIGQLETEIRSLERERARLVAVLGSQSLTEDKIETLQRLATRSVRGLELAEADFETRRRIVDLLDVRAHFAVEDGEQVIYVSCELAEGRLALAKGGSLASSLDNRALPFVIHHRLIIPRPAVRRKRSKEDDSE
jgi:hypothetical protein